MPQPHLVYAGIVTDLENVELLKEALIAKAFSMFETQDVALAGMVSQTTRDRRSASHWMCRPVRRLDGRTPYQALADGEEEKVWDELLEHIPT